MMSEPTTTCRPRVDQRIELRRHEAINQRAGELMFRTGNVVDRHGSAIIFGAAFLMVPLFRLMMAPGPLGWIPYSPMVMTLGGFGMVATVIVAGHLYLYRRAKWYRRRVVEVNPCLRCGQPLRGVPAGLDEKVVCPECGHAVSARAPFDCAGGVALAEGARIREATPTRRELVDRQEAIWLRARALMRNTGNVLDRHGYVIAAGLCLLALALFWLLVNPSLLGWISLEPMVLVVANVAVLAPLIGIDYYRKHRLNWYIIRVSEEDPCMHCGHSLKGVPAGLEETVVCPECGHAGQTAEE